MVFSNALSSPIRRSLQPYHLEQGGDAGYFANGVSRDVNPTASNDSSMDMHSDSPAHDSYWAAPSMEPEERTALLVEEVCCHSLPGLVGIFNLTPSVASYTKRVMFCVVTTTYHLLLCQDTVICMYYTVPFDLSVHITVVGMSQVQETNNWKELTTWTVCDGWSWFICYCCCHVDTELLKLAVFVFVPAETAYI